MTKVRIQVCEWKFLHRKSYLLTFIRPLYGFGFSDYCYKNNIRNCFMAIWLIHRFFVTLCINR